MFFVVFSFVFHIVSELCLESNSHSCFDILDVVH